MKSWRGAYAKLTGRLYLGQWIGNLLLMLLAAAWLQIPDSHTWQFVFSVLSGVLLVIGFLGMYDLTFRWLRRSVLRPPRWQSWLLLAAFVVLWWVAMAPIASGRAHEALFAGYWNSQSPRWLRFHLGYSQLVAWQECIYDCLQWIWAGLVLPLAVETCSSGLRAGWFPRAARVYAHWLYWLTVLFAGLGSSWITWALADWVPDAGLLGQTFSIAARLGVAYSLDVLLWCLVLCLVASILDGVSGPAE